MEIAEVVIFHLMLVGRAVSLGLLIMLLQQMMAILVVGRLTPWSGVLTRLSWETTCVHLGVLGGWGVSRLVEGILRLEQVGGWLRH
jgi:hypothetical protein